MQIEIHGFTVVMHGMNDEDVIELCKILHIEYILFKQSAFGDRRILVHAFGKAKESVYFSINNAGEEHSYARLTLHGSFFDNSPDFKFRTLLRFISQFRPTPKQLDVAFNDDKKCLTIKEIRHWCADCDDYCKGSLATKLNAPEERTRRREFVRIELSSAKSQRNYGTIYVRPDTGFIRFEIKFRNRDKIEYLLENYSRKNPEQFESRSREALVSCIDFITPQSKKRRTVSKYRKQRSWKKFLGSDVKRVNWNEILKEKRANRAKSDKEMADKTIKAKGKK